MGSVKYIVAFIDNYSKRYWMYPIKKKVICVSSVQGI